MKNTNRLLGSSIFFLIACGLIFTRLSSSFALPGFGQLPGHGVVANGVSGVSYNLTAPNQATLTVSSPTAILWQSSGGTLNVTGSGPGFNVGSGAIFIISSTNTAYNPVLNVDTTGNPSMIFGRVQSVSTAPFILANGSGIVVGSSGIITSPAGVGIIGYNVPLSVAKDFTGYGLGIVPGLTGSYVTIQTGASITYGPTNIPPITKGSPVGSALLVTAPQITVGIATASSLNGGSANHFLDFLSGYQFLFSFRVLGDNNGFRIAPTPISGSSGSITINGSSSGSPFSFPTYSYLLSSGNIITNGNVVLPGGPFIQWGTGNKEVWQGWLYNYGNIAFAQTLDPQTLSTRGSLLNYGSIFSYPAAPFYNAQGQLLSIIPSTPTLVLWVNGSIINQAGAVMNASSTISGSSTTGGIDLWAQQGAIINHGWMQGYDFINLFAQNPNQLNTQFPLGSVFSNGTLAISSPTASTDSFTNPGNGAISAFAPLYLHQLTTTPNINLWISSATGNVYLPSGSIQISDPNGIHAAALSASKSGGVFLLDLPFTSQLVSFKGGGLTGSGVITTNQFHLSATGDVRNVVSPTNPLLNGFTIANGPFSSTSISIDAEGSTPQIINLHVNGNATIDSAATSTFVNSVFFPTKGLTNPVPNAGGNLLVNATGNLTVNGSVPSSYALSTDILGLSNAFVFPGGVALKAGGMLTLNTTIDNGYTAVAGPNFQGVFLSAPQIFVSGPFVTSGNTIVHASGPISAAVYVASPVSPVFPSIYTAVLSTTNGPVVSPFPWQQ